MSHLFWQIVAWIIVFTLARYAIIALLDGINRIWRR